MKHFLNVYAIVGLFITLGTTSFLHAVTIGSDTAVTRFNTQQQLNDGDRVAGFAALAGGFEIFSLTQTATFDSFFPVTGAVSFNGGSLYLGRDLIFRNVSDLRSLGNIIGVNHSMEFAPSMTCIPTFNFDEGGCMVTHITGADQPENAYTVDWSFDSVFVAVGMNVGGGGSTVLNIYQYNGATLTLKTSSSLDSFTTINLLRWHPSKFMFALVRPTVAGALKEVRIFSFNPVTGGITETSGLNPNVDVFACAWHPTGKYLAIAQNTALTEIAVYAVDNAGVIGVSPIATYDITGGSIPVSHNSLDWDKTGKYLAFGTETNPAVIIAEFNEMASSLVFTVSRDDYGHDAVCLDWNRTFSQYMAIGLNGTSDKLRLLEFIPTSSVGAQLLDRILVQVPGNAVPASCDWAPGGRCLVEGWGNGDAILHRFDPIALTMDQQDIEMLNGNGIDSIRWTPNGRYFAYGQSNDRLEVFNTNSTDIPVDTGCVTYSDLTIYLSNNMCFQDCCIHFKGNCSIIGRGKCLSLLPTCTLIVDPNSSLLWEDIKIMGIETNNIQMSDNTSTMSFKNVEWIQDGNYNFPVGHFDVLADFELSGEGYTFAYLSPSVSTIQPEARIILDHNFTFSYAPTIADRDLIKLVDDTAQLILNGNTLFSTTTGMRLTKGDVIVASSSSLSADGTLAGQGISFGDGVSAANNISQRLFPAAVLNVVRGLLEYNNI